MRSIAITLAALGAVSQALAQNISVGKPAATPIPSSAMNGLGITLGTNAVPEEMQQGMAAAAQFLQAMQNGSNNNPLASVGGKPAVDFRELKAILPDAVAGLPRTNARGEKSGAFGVQISTAEGNYGSPDGSHIEVKIADLGAMGQLGAVAQFGWMATDIDRENDEGYERTLSYQGNKALEKYSPATKAGSVKLMTGGRFMIEIQGEQIESAQLKAAVDGINFNALTDLANKNAAK